MFVDSAVIQVRAGKGGNGALSFRRERYIPKGGPNGGDGGRGGDVVLKANPQLRTLLDFRYKREYAATNGTPGEGSNKTGRSGESLIIHVPAGTLVYRNDNEHLIGDLVEAGEELVVAHGGRGGRGNARFTTSTNRAPRKWEQGKPGEELAIRLELKLIADIGLVGAPNAGKSTLLSVLTDARPKVADYPFTTLTPNLGLAKFGDWNSALVADIPGLIEGAHHGKGLGHDFLKHIERTRLLLVLVDVTVDDPAVERQSLLDELRLFNKKLLDRPMISILTKSDLLTNDNDRIPAGFDLTISSVTGDHISELKHLLWARLSPLLEEE